MNNNKYPHKSLDDVAREVADGHYVQQSKPGPNPERDKMISEAIAKIKAESKKTQAH